MTLPPDRLSKVLNWRHENFGKGRDGNFTSFFGAHTIEHDRVWNVTLETSLMDRFIDWKLRSPAQARNSKISAIAEGDHMIRQFTIELRVNYADAEKNETMRSSCASAARHMFATANLLADGQKPEIAIFSDDWFAGKEEISLLEDVIQKGLDESSASVTEGEVSSELMKAAMDSGS